MRDVQRPRILLLGNGLLQAYGKESWTTFLEDINRAGLTEAELESKEIPAPLKAILATNDQVNAAMKEKCKKMIQTPLTDDGFVTVLQQILCMGFDHIFTTNYTYELEQSAVYPDTLTRYRLDKMVTCSVSRRKDKSLLRTRNCVTLRGVENRIWHIHGEVRSPNSTVLGHYYYGNLLYRIREIANSCRPSTFRREPQEFDSWVQAFLCGDVYCLGFGYDFSEFDLWWLLNRKAREKCNEGRVYFYEPKEREGEGAKIRLLKLLKRATGGEPLVTVRDMDYENPKNDNEAWKCFYGAALADIRKLLKQA